MVSHVLGPLAEGVAPILVPVLTEPLDTITDPKQFAGHLVQVIVDYAAGGEFVTDNRRNELLRNSTPTRSVAKRGRLVSRARMSTPPLPVSLSVEVQRQLDQADALSRSGAAMFEMIDQALAAIAATKLTPALIFDDTDRWLRGEDHETAAAAFFEQALPHLRELGCALVVAVHHHYLDDATLNSSINRVLERRIIIPELHSASALRAILASRVHVHCRDGRHDTIDDVMTPRAIEALLAQFDGELRRVLRTTHGALAIACDDHASLITPELIDAADW